MKELIGKITKADLKGLKAGDQILFTGTVYTARDQAHKRLVDLIKSNKKLPFDLSGQIIYYCGPTATKPGNSIGSCGPTTSSRMDNFTLPLLKKGMIAMIGKGGRSANVKAAIKKFGCIYFVAPAGCGALLSKKVKSKKLVAFGELGPEAIYKLEVVDFPLVVVIDSSGKDLFK